MGEGPGNGRLVYAEDSVGGAKEARRPGENEDLLGGGFYYNHHTHRTWRLLFSGGYWYSVGSVKVDQKPEDHDVT
jgi:hypothetical protein